MKDKNLPDDHQGIDDPGQCKCTFLYICEYHEVNGLAENDDEYEEED